jgi:hypothetical protein
MDRCWNTERRRRTRPQADAKFSSPAQPSAPCGPFATEGVRRFVLTDRMAAPDPGRFPRHASECTGATRAEPWR